MKVCAIDNGYDSIKIYDGKKLVRFKSRIEETKDTINQNNTFKVEYQGSTYIVGDGAANNYIEYDKTANDYHRIFTLAGLSRVMDSYTEHFKIVAGYPLNLYTSNKSIFSKYLKTNEVSFIMDNQPRKVAIDDCLVFPQGAGSLFVEPSRYKDKIVSVLDIGGLTVNGVVFDRLNMRTQSAFTVNQGCIILYNKLLQKLNNEFSLNIQEYEIPTILQNGLVINGEKQKSQKLIDDILFEHCNAIKAECRRYNWNIETLDILITGGGAIVLDGHIQRVFPQARIVENPVYSNVLGFYEIGKRYYA